MSARRTYKVSPVVVNGVRISKVVIDPHYEEKHGKTINDDLILALVAELNGRVELPDSRYGEYSYFATLVEHKDKQYRLVWLLEDHAIYIGVINAYRDRRKK